jgi:hypothetical protein
VAVVLCTGIDPILLETRKLILERAGHTVIPATNPGEVEEVCGKDYFDVAVLGQTLVPESKREIAAIIRRCCPSAKILELYQPHKAKALEDADSWLEVPAAVPQQLAERVALLAQQEPRKRTPG